MRIVGIHQPHYLPWLRYFEKIARCDVFIVLDTVQFNKNGWQNRNAIKTPEGRGLLTVPVHANLDDPISAIEIDNRGPWQRKHMRSIEQHYAGAPYFDLVMPKLRPFYEEAYSHIADLDIRMMMAFMSIMEMETPVVRASELDTGGIATGRLINLIKAVDGDAYYSGAYALDVYLDADALQRANTDLVIQEWTAPTYPQRYPPFIPDLSIVDLVMNTGRDAKSLLLQEKAP